MSDERNNEHARNSASSAHRWLECPGSINLVHALENQGMIGPDVTNEWAAYGTFAHAIAAECLNERRDAWEHMGEKTTIEGHDLECDDEMVDCIQLYLDVVLEDLRKYGGSLYVEHQESLEGLFSGGDDTGGTMDAGFLGADNWARCYDLKSGFILVEADNNPQLKIYGLELLHKVMEPKARAQCEGVELVIVQPRAGHPMGPVRRWRMTKTDLNMWMSTELALGVFATYEQEGDLRDLKGGDHCKYCRAQPRCAEFMGIISNVVDLIADKPLDEMQSEELTSLKERWPMVQDYFSAVDERIFNELMKGGDVAGQKLVEGKSRRKWKEGAEKVAEHAWGAKVLEKPKLLSPAQLAKLGPKQKAFVKTWAFSPTGKLTVAPEDDKRDAVVRSVDDPTDTFGDMIETST